MRYRTAYLHLKELMVIAFIVATASTAGAVVAPASLTIPGVGTVWTLAAGAAVVYVACLVVFLLARVVGSVAPFLRDTIRLYRSAPARPDSSGRR